MELVGFIFGYILRVLIDIAFVLLYAVWNVVKAVLRFVFRLIAFPYVVYLAFRDHPDDEPWSHVWKFYWDNCRTGIILIGLAVFMFSGIFVGEAVVLIHDDLDAWGEKVYAKHEMAKSDSATYDLSKHMNDEKSE